MIDYLVRYNAYIGVAGIVIVALLMWRGALKSK